MATTAFMTEFRSCMTFECKTSLSATAGFPESPDPRMVPKQHPELDRKSSDPEQARESPVSSPGTSMTSSPAAMNGMMRNYGDSDDSESIPSGDTEETRSPLEQLKSALEKKFHMPSYPPQTLLLDDTSNAYYDGGELYKCHLCSYSSSSKQQFNLHMNSHFDHKCPFCDYTSRTEGRLKRHVKDFHSETPPDSWAGTRVPRNEGGSGGEQSMDDSVTSTGNGKSRSYRCKQCDFVAYQKNDFWEHNKTHIKAEKLLTCPKCAFVTEYKHHLEYHLRNHFGSKPFKCGKCNYSCVNKSMLNSHMKSHSNIYQYRCADCTYATKYCHSLKLHLRKYSHKPATVLNMDGTPNPYPVIDVYGTRRGPRTKKRKNLEDQELNPVSTSTIVPSPPSVNYPPVGPLLPPNVPVMYHPQFFNSYHGNIFVRPPDGGSSYASKHPLKCLLCDFVTDHQEVFHKHMLLHAASENQDLIKLYGINSDTIFQMQEQQMALNNYQRNFREAPPHNPDQEVMFREANTTPQHVERDVKPPKDNYESEMKVSPISDGAKSPISHSKDEEPAPMEFKESASQVESERSVIVSHRSLTPNYIQESPVENPEPKPESSPLDLSNTKASEKEPKEFQPLNDNEKENEDAKERSSDAMQQCHSRNRRKGKAFKLDHYMHFEDQAPPNHYDDRRPERMLEENQNLKPHLPDAEMAKPEPEQHRIIVPIVPKVELNIGETSAKWQKTYTCLYCDMAFRDCVMYTMHMGYHGFANPFKCNICGLESKNKVEFFLHIARIAHV